MYGGFSLSHLFIGLAFAGFGILFVKYSFALTRITDDQGWLERFTGPGSTNGVYKLFGVLLVILGILVGSGFGADVMNFLLSPFSSIFKNLGSN